MITSEVVTVTPEMAQEWLDNHNTRNRTIRPHRVDRYANDIQRGRWQVAQAIMFDKFDNLLDGQHRLAAIVQVGTPVQALVTKGLEPEAYDVIDAGMTRTSADVMRHRGLPADLGLAAGTRWWMLAEAGFSPSDRHAGNLITSEDVADYLEKHPGWVTFLTTTANACRANSFSPNSPWVAFTWGALKAGVQRVDITAFQDAVRFGANLDRDDPQLGLRNLILNRSKGDKGYDLFSTIVDVWNLHVAGVRRRAVRWTPCPADWTIPPIAVPKTARLEAVS